MSTKIVRDKDFLHRITEPVLTIQEGDEIAQQLLDVLANVKPFGVGLSANQIGILKSVSVIVLPDQSPLILMNPEIVETSPEKIIYTEGCLSIPGRTYQTLRHVRLTVKTLNHANPLMFAPDVEPITAESSAKDYGLLKCICVQHEIGHLNGQIICDDGVRFIPPPAKAIVKYGRNDRVMIEKDGMTQYLKYKKALELIEREGWKLL
jgi:peptide deformylase